MTAAAGARSACFVAAAALTCACTTTARRPVRPASSHAQEVTKLRFFPPPLALAEPEDAIVRIVLPGTTCSGTLVAEDLVLTAHHCVVRLSVDGTYGTEIVDPARVVVELGGDYLPWGNIAAKAIVAPPCGEAGGTGDVALIVLPRRLVGIAPFPVRLDAAPRIGEVIDPAGFGRCATSASGIHRERRAGSAVASVGLGTLTLSASICPGDSGGPAFARGSHEVVGVVSMSAMDGDASTQSPTVMARVDVMRPLFAAARLIADGAAKNELPPLSCNR
jgi:hypothetical protein